MGSGCRRAAPAFSPALKPVGLAILACLRSARGATLQGSSGPWTILVILFPTNHTLMDSVSAPVPSQPLTPDIGSRGTLASRSLAFAPLHLLILLDPLMKERHASLYAPHSSAPFTDSEHSGLMWPHWQAGLSPRSDRPLDRPAAALKCNPSSINHALRSKLYELADDIKSPIGKQKRSFGPLTLTGAA